MSPCVSSLHFPLCLLMSLLQRDTAGINGIGQPHDNFMTVARKFFLSLPQQNDPPALFGRRGACLGTPTPSHKSIALLLGLVRIRKVLAGCGG